MGQMEYTPALTQKGFERPTYDVLLNRQITRAKELFSTDIDTDENTALGKFLRIIAYDLAMLYEEMEDIYYGCFPHYATGKNLDRLMPFAQTTRNPAVYAQHKVKLVLRDNAPEEPTLDSSFKLTTADGVIFHFSRWDGGLIAETKRSRNAVFTCDKAGITGNVPKGALEIILNPNSMIESVQHLEQVVVGQEDESDESLRNRFDMAIRGGGSSTLDAIRGEIMRVPGVSGCVIEENTLDEAKSSNLVDKNGVKIDFPPHSFLPYILYGAPEDTADVETVEQQIAEAIFRKKPLGIASCGNIAKEVKGESGGDLHTVKFAKVEKEPVYVKIKVEKNVDFPDDGRQQIIKKITDHINAFENGRDVVHSTLYKLIYSVKGVEDVTELMIGTKLGVLKEENIILAPHKVARIERILFGEEDVTDYGDK